MARDKLQISNREFKNIAKLLYEHAGIALKDSKKSLVRSRLRKRLRELDMDSFEEYYDRVTGDKSGKELSYLVDALSTNVTSFFRENKHFEFIKKEIFPRLEKKLKSAPGKHIHFWSAACSTGQEPYSMAITFLENFPRANMRDIKILGTDISREAVQTARRGVYPRKVVKDVNPLLVKKYFKSFTNDEGRRMVQVKDIVKDFVRFGILNLNRDKKFPFNKKFDVIFSRNVMIYFDNPVVERLVNRFYRYLKNDGYLFVGHSESLTRIQHNFDYVKATIYRK